MKIVDRRILIAAGRIEDEDELHTDVRVDACGSQTLADGFARLGHQRGSRPQSRDDIAEAIAEVNLAIARQQKKRDTGHAGWNPGDRGGIGSLLRDDRHDRGHALEIVDADGDQQSPTCRADRGAQPLEKRAKPSAGCIHRCLLDGA
jgi:hypothetical protein